MVTATLVLVSLLLVAAAGEAVRVQCRRMLAAPARAHARARAANGALAPVGGKVAA
jgi:hypothetical protein